MRWRSESPPSFDQPDAAAMVPAVMMSPGMATAPAAGLETAAVCPQVPVEQVVANLVGRNLERAQSLPAYRSSRKYRVDYRGFPGSRNGVPALKIRPVWADTASILATSSIMLSITFIGKPQWLNDLNFSEPYDRSDRTYSDRDGIDRGRATEDQHAGDRPRSQARSRFLRASAGGAVSNVRRRSRGEVRAEHRRFAAGAASRSGSTSLARGEGYGPRQRDRKQSSDKEQGVSRGDRISRRSEWAPRTGGPRFPANFWKSGAAPQRQGILP